MLALTDVLRALKQHMLEEMSKSGPTRLLIARADVVSHRNRIGRRAVIFGEQDAESILELEFFEGDVVCAVGLDRFCRGSRLRWLRTAFGGFGLRRPDGEWNRGERAAEQPNCDYPAPT